MRSAGASAPRASTAEPHAPAQLQPHDAPTGPAAHHVAGLMAVLLCCVVVNCCLFTSCALHEARQLAFAEDKPMIVIALNNNKHIFLASLAA